MKPLSLLFVALILSIAVLCTAQTDKPLTNDDVIRMVQEKVDEDVIMRAINTSEINFDISPNGLIQLKKGKVKKRIIEAIQDAQLRKNNSRSTSSSSNNSGGILTRLGTTPVATPSPPPLPAPTPKPTPVATQKAEFFTFDLENCSGSGSSIICYFTITNNAQDRELGIGYCFGCYSELVDDVGTSSRTLHYIIGNTKIVNLLSPVNLLRNASIKAWFKFDDVSPDAHKVGRLLISFEAKPGSLFKVEFRDVPIERH